MLDGAIWVYRIFKDFEKLISSKKLYKNKSGAKDQYTIRCNLGIDVVNQKTLIPLFNRLLYGKVKFYQFLSCLVDCERVPGTGLLCTPFILYRMNINLIFLCYVKFTIS